ncbi:MAG: hypothetical protein IPL63_03095 [Saprospiraceae bacterium]|nr:hypothetical protein [Saprospiraceae bacterium]MBK6566734.1 hypothetical protein [Saprospiraceae bacterium]MBK7522930.1 hypothetical protein [Saprospiraceae bacterium]MBK8370692.1 hypothetical protein [Saprospiraceae bacterium]MBK8546395.1 hypothetical protein [Saprospiraceae bacterium]
MKTILTFLFLGVIFTATSVAQDDLLSLLGPEEETTEYIEASFKTNRVVNLHSLENTAAGVLDFKISHRFGFLSGGFYEFFGLDNATMRLGFDYGITNRLAIGVGRSNLEKAYDGYIKYKLLRQSKGKKNMPLTVALFASAAIQTLKWAEPERDNLFSSRLYYTFQVIMGRKFSERISVQLSPTVVHRNLVATKEEKNDVYGMGVGARFKLTNRIAINGEYTFVLPNQLADGYNNGLSIGFDIETGGHVFQLHCTNSTGMIEKAFFTENTGNWSTGNVHFGFNISRVFTLKKKKE